MAHSSFRFNSFVDNMAIECTLWRVDRPRAAVVISHGAAEHALRYTRFAQQLVGHRFVTYANDHRGHGRTARGQLGDLGEGGWDALVDDMDQLVTIARNQNPSVPVILFGHSMGSAAAQQYVLDRSLDIDALILSGSTAWQPVPEGQKLSLEIGGFEGRTPFDWLSRDPDEVDKYIADPLCGFQFEKLPWADASGRQRLFDAQSFKSVRSDLPCLLVAGDKDPINANMQGLAVLEGYYRDAGLEVDKLYYQGGRHEMLNETNRVEVMSDIIAWIEKQLPEQA